MIILYKNFTKSLKTTREGTKRSKKKKSYIAYVCHKKRQFLAKKKMQPFREKYIHFNHLQIKNILFCILFSHLGNPGPWI